MTTGTKPRKVWRGLAKKFAGLPRSDWNDRLNFIGTHVGSFDWKMKTNAGKTNLPGFFLYIIIMFYLHSKVQNGFARLSTEVVTNYIKMNTYLQNFEMVRKKTGTLF